jgi:transcriptional regulator with XRE-family HTH domain
MTEPAPARGRLAARLKQLREASDLGRLTQEQLAAALGVSTPSISSWESAKAMPPENRLRAYARLFATPRSKDGDHLRLLPTEDLTAEERRATETLIDELVQLHHDAQHGVEPARRETGSLGGRFWYFPDRQSITILCTPLSGRQLGYDPNGALPAGAPPISAYSRSSHPNYIESLRNGDIDAAIELVGHIRAENPTAEVRWTTFDRIRDKDELTGHVIILGGGDFHAARPSRLLGNPVRWFVRRLNLPIATRIPERGDEEFDMEFVVTTDEGEEPTSRGPREEVYRPVFLRDETRPDRPRVLVDGAPQLEYDVALLARKANPLNQSASMTICTGVFSRGTYGAVRTLTDAKLRARNERLLHDHFPNVNDFWILFYVPVFGGMETITPDLARTFHRLRDSAEQPDRERTNA